MRFVLCYVSGLVLIGHSPSTLITIIYEEEERRGEESNTNSNYTSLASALYILHVSVQ